MSPKHKITSLLSTPADTHFSDNIFCSRDDGWCLNVYDSRSPPTVHSRPKGGSSRYYGCRIVSYQGVSTLCFCGYFGATRLKIYQKCAGGWTWLDQCSHLKPATATPQQGIHRPALIRHQSKTCRKLLQDGTNTSHDKEFGTQRDTPPVPREMPVKQGQRKIYSGQVHSEKAPVTQQDSLSIQRP
ncbi:hypothetical protein Bbelb_136300 [Branchiostoma belcheri]|nr:hypothetical protein Bbelb_136300 [Branchiostoma belcheri]